MKMVKEELSYDYSPDIYLVIHSSWPQGTVVARYYNTIAGFIMAALIRGGAVWVVLLVVKRQYQSKGLGSTLLREIIGRAIKQGAPYITLEVRVENFKAIALYKKFGFRIEERKPNFYRDGGDAFRMKKILIS